MPSEQQAEKVREDLNRYRHPGANCFWRRGTIILCILRILDILIQTIDIKVLSDLVILFPAVSIDIQVLSDLQQSTLSPLGPLHRSSC